MRSKKTGFYRQGRQGRQKNSTQPTSRRVEIPEIGIMRVADGKWVERWYFGGELGMLLQLGAVEMLQGQVTAP